MFTCILTVTFIQKINTYAANHYINKQIIQLFGIISLITIWNYFPDNSACFVVLCVLCLEIGTGCFSTPCN